MPTDGASGLAYHWRRPACRETALPKPREAQRRWAGMEGEVVEESRSGGGRRRRRVMQWRRERMHYIVLRWAGSDERGVRGQEGFQPNPNQ